MTTEHIPPRTFIADLLVHLGKQVRVCGFVDTVRSQKRMQFIVLRDWSGAVQLVNTKGDDTLTDIWDKLTLESAIMVVGRVVSAPTVKLGGIEIVIETVEVCGVARGTAADCRRFESIEKENGLPTSRFTLSRSADCLLTCRQVTLEHAMREFWMTEGFMEIHSPKLMGTFSESGAEAFSVKYFEDKAYLAQSPQFYMLSSAEN